MEPRSKPKSSTPAKAASRIPAEKQSYDTDAAMRELNSTKGCPGLLIKRVDECTVIASFSTEWMKRVMQVSSAKMVPFRYYGEGKPKPEKLDERQYPRAFSTPIVIGGQKKVDDKSGGRRRDDDAMWQYAVELTNLYGAEASDACIHSTCRLSDVLIVHKRNFTQDVVDTQGQLQTLDCRNTLPDAQGYKAQLLQPYPLLCSYLSPKFLKTHSLSPADQKVKGYARIAQVVFTAHLNQLLLKEGCPLEAVAREGFGSVVPSVSDIGNGIRLDPGLLPPEHAKTVVKALQQTDEFMASLKPGDLKDLAADLGGFGGEKLKRVDGLTEALLRSDLAKPANIKRALEKPTECKGDLPNRLAENRAVAFPISCLRPIPQAAKENTLKDSDEPPPESLASGYGSDSEDELTVEKRPAPPPVIHKAAFVSGMATLQIVTEVGRQYLAALPKPEKPKAASSGKSNSKEEEPESAKPYAPYFEADQLPLPPGLVHFNAAPNPGNAYQGAQLPLLGADPICTIDVTNLATQEKAELVRGFLQACAQQGPQAAAKLLILEESASKHPTGGDLVYGVVRVVGRGRKVLRSA